MRNRYFIGAVVLSLQAGPLVSQGLAADTTVQRRETLSRIARELQPGLVELRRDLHRHPELSNREERTSRIVADRLKALGITEVRTNVGRHGVVALLKGGRPGRVVALRADMDALPIQEAREVPYRSQNAGVMHACGHDVHTTIGLGVAEALFRIKEQLPGTVKFIFQPAEEGPPAGEEGGAQLMIREGALEDPRPAAIFALHVMPTLQVGQIGYNYDATMAASDRFVITVRGKKVHGAYPHEGIDAVVVAAECVAALQTIRSRRINTQEPLVVTIGSIAGGNRFNIIADEVQMVGTIRTHSEETRRRVHQLIREIVAGVCSAHGAVGELELGAGTPPTRNDRSLVEAMLPTLQAVVGPSNTVSRAPQMGAEDFSRFAEVVPGFYFFLGVANPSKGITAMVHTPEFDVDEECLSIGVNVMSNMALDFLHRP